MLRPKPPHPSINILFPDKLNGKNDEAKNKDQQADTVDAVHVFYKITFRPVRIGFSEKKVFRYLFPDTH